jgi:hypothetical protein
MLEITFPTSTAAEANVLARRLRTEFADAGVPADRLELRRTDSENMDVGALLQIAPYALDALAVVAGHTFAEVIFHFARRNRSGIRIKSPFGQFDVNSDKEDPERIAEFLHRMAELFHGRSDK